MHRISLIYVYGTGQEAMRFAVSAAYEDDCPASTIALFVTPGDAARYAKEKAAALGVNLSILPSAAAVREAQETRDANESVNVWGTPKELINSDEFCPECERAVPSHYANCPLYRK